MTGRHERRPFDLNHQRLKDLARFIVMRYDRLTAADDWITYVEAACWHCPLGRGRRTALLQWCEWVCAPLSMRQPRVLDELLRRFQPRRVSADRLGRILGITDVERTACHIGTFGACDVSKAEREKRKKERHRMREQARRYANGTKPREQSFSRTKPWEKEGISRRTWARRLAQIRAHDSFFLQVPHELVPHRACGKKVAADDERASRLVLISTLASPLTSNSRRRTWSRNASDRRTTT